MDLAQILALVVAGNTLITFVTAAYNLLSTRGTKALDGLAKLSDALSKETASRKMGEDATLARFAEMAGRVQRLETEFGHLPDQQAVHQLQLTLKDMQVEIAKISASAERSARTSDRVEQFLMERAK